MTFILLDLQKQIIFSLINNNVEKTLKCVYTIIEYKMSYVCAFISIVEVDPGTTEYFDNALPAFCSLIQHSLSLVFLL